MTCPACKTDQPDTTNFCQRCGAKLPTGPLDYKALAEHAEKQSGRLGCLGILALFFLLPLLGKLESDLAGGITLIVLFGVSGVLLIRRAIHYHRLQSAYKSKLPTEQELAERARKEQEEDARKVEERKRQQHQELLETKLHVTPVDILSMEERSHHVWIPGVSGSGKTTLMQWMAIHDIYDGITLMNPETKQTSVLSEMGETKLTGKKKGVTIIDPAGDLVSRLLPWIPPERVPDTIYLDLNHPVPVDFLSCENPSQKRTVVANILSLFEIGRASCRERV